MRYQKAYWLWLLVIAFLVAFFVVFFEHQLFSYFAVYGLGMVVLILIGRLLLLLFVVWFFGFKEAVSRQKIHERPSYVNFLVWGVIVGLPLSALMKLGYPIIYSYSFYSDSGFFVLDLAMCTVLSIFVLSWYVWQSQSRYENEELQHAHGAVGLQDDSLGFSNVADSLARIIKSSEKNVNVIAVLGGMGFGKSSLLRMALERIQRSTFLYTYISLTESNREKDFSKLFADRWFQSLNARYPKIKHPSVSFGLNEVLREYNGDWITTLIKFVFSIEKALFKTKACCFDEYYSSRQKSWVGTNIASIFGSIDVFHEDMWIVIVDEIERANPEEIYRVIEVMERFKNEGRSGLPLKLVFLLPISFEQLEFRMSENCNSTDLLRLVKEFFSHGSKSITQFFHMPSLSSKVVIKMLKEKILSRFSDLYSSLKFELRSYYSLDGKEFIDNSSFRLGAVVGLLSDLNLRAISRIVDSTYSICILFSRYERYVLEKNLPLSDVMALEYLGVCHPRVRKFLADKLYIFLSSDWDVFEEKERLKERYKGFLEWFTDETGIVLTDSQKIEIVRLVKLSAYFYWDFFSKNKSETDYVEARFETTSHPEYLADYFSLYYSSVQSIYKRNYSIYEEHKKSGTEVLGKLSDEDLDGYSVFLYRIHAEEYKIFLEVSNFLYERFHSINKIQVGINPRVLTFEGLYYSFAYSYANVIMNQIKLSKKEEDFTTTFNNFNRFLSNEAFHFEPRFIMLNSLANKSRGGNSQIHLEMRVAFGSLLEKGRDRVKATVNNLFAHFRLKVKQSNLLMEEQNFFFVIYQTWSGDASNQAEIDAIRKYVLECISYNPELLNFFWDQMPVRDEKNATVRDLTAHYHERNKSFYLSLKDLIETSRLYVSVLSNASRSKLSFWSGISSEDLRNFDSNFSDDKTTLVASLIDQGLLDGPIWSDF